MNNRRKIIQQLTAKYDRLCKATRELNQKDQAIDEQFLKTAPGGEQEARQIRKLTIVDDRLAAAWKLRFDFEGRHPEAIAYAIQDCEDVLKKLRARLRCVASKKALRARWLELAADSAPLAVLVQTESDPGSCKAGEERDTGFLAFRLENEVFLVSAGYDVWRRTYPELQKDCCKPGSGDTLILRPAE